MGAGVLGFCICFQQLPWKGGRERPAGWAEQVGPACWAQRVDPAVGPASWFQRVGQVDPVDAESGVNRGPVDAESGVKCFPLTPRAASTGVR